VFIRNKLWILILVLVFSFTQVSWATAQGEVVRVVLFYSPTCSHCHKVISEDLPPLIERYGGALSAYYIPPSPEEAVVGAPMYAAFGGQLEILYVNIYTLLGQELFYTAVDLYQVPSEYQAVPTMIVGGYVLIGGYQIPEELPGIIEQGLASGGIDWPDIPGLSEAMSQLVVAPTPAPTEVPTESTTEEASPTGATTETVPNATTANTTPNPEATTTTNGNNPVGPEIPEISVIERIKLDLAGNLLSIVVLIGMVISVAVATSRIVLPEIKDEAQGLSWLILLLCAAGIGVAGYLTYVEASGRMAVCGPVGDCNSVQQSKYAVLFGVIPIGALGLAGYVAIIIAWLVSWFEWEPFAHWAKVLLLAMTLFGTLFSIYLTFLEPFVIGATCAWCLTSSVIMTLLMWLTLEPGIDALMDLLGKK
jgi:uncharacterized membrane protein